MIIIINNIDINILLGDSNILNKPFKLFSYLFQIKTKEMNIQLKKLDDFLYF